MIVAAILLAGSAMLTVGRVVKFLWWEKIALDSPQVHLYVPSGSSLSDLIRQLHHERIVPDTALFRWAARLMKFEKVHPGHYLITSGWTHKELIDVLRKGLQQPVMVVIRSISYPDELAGRIARQLEADSAELMDLLTDSAYLAAKGFTPVNALAMFTENSYEFYWTTSARAFMERMHREYLHFWNADRREAARRLGLSIIEVAILASIVQKETQKFDEMPRIAGVYLNRLRRGMRLQADPTVQYALRKWQRRLKHRHTRIASPFNTYIHTGLPPGPIAVPKPQAIDAVLNAEEHDYLFFCARDDFSGYHAFARTYREHLRNARRYQRALSQRGIH